MRNLKLMFLGLTALAFATQPVHAAPFTDQSASAWVTRADNVLRAVYTDNGQTPQIARMVSACKGMTGDLSTYANSWPEWASYGLNHMCGAARAMDKQEKWCDDLKSAAKYLGKADASREPAEVIRAAGALKATATELLAYSKSQKLC